MNLLNIFPDLFHCFVDDAVNFGQLALVTINLADTLFPQRLTNAPLFIVLVPDFFHVIHFVELTLRRTATLIIIERALFV